MRATACSPGQVLAALGRLMCKDREPAQRATGCPASLVGVTRCRPLRGLADSMLPDPGLRVLALGYTLSPAARAGRLDAAGPRAASTCPGLHAVARCAGSPLLGLLSCPLGGITGELNLVQKALNYRRSSRAFRPRIAPAIIRFTAASDSPPSSVAGIVANPIADAFG